MDTLCTSARHASPQTRHASMWTACTWSALVHRLGVASLAAYTQRLGSLMADRLSFAPQLSCTCYMHGKWVEFASMQSCGWLTGGIHPLHLTQGGHTGQSPAEPEQPPQCCRLHFCRCHAQQKPS